MTPSQFSALSEDGQLKILNELFANYQFEKEVELLTSLDQLSPLLMGRLARAYNNSFQEAKAMAILNQIPEEYRDYTWFYRYAYSMVYSLWPNFLETNFDLALTFLEKAVVLAESEQDKEECLELLFYRLLISHLKSKKQDFPQLYALYHSWQASLSLLSDFHWCFSQTSYSPEDFTQALDVLMTECVGQNWKNDVLNQPIEHAHLVVVYEAWIESLDQLHINEIIENADELDEADKEDGLWQVRVMARLTADNGKCFTSLELLYKLHHLMANKELGDHIFFEGLEPMNAGGHPTVFDVILGS